MTSRLPPRLGSATARLAFVVAISAFALTLVARPAEGQTISPSISPARIAVESLVASGEEVELPALGVRNEGDTDLRFRMEARPGNDASMTAIDWVRFEPEEFDLAALDGRAVQLKLDVPGGATPGSYRLLLSAAVAPKARSPDLNVAISAAVASGLTFEVGARPVEETSPFARYWVAGLLGLVTVLAGMGGYKAMELARNVDIDVSVRRKRSVDGAVEDGPNAEPHETGEDAREQSS